jgi:glucose uptake protein GlcU
MSLFSIFAVQIIGISIAQTVWSTIGIILGFTMGIIFFKEKFSNYIAPIFGILIISIGFILISFSGVKKGNKTVLSYFMGMIFSILTGVLNNISSIPIKYDGSLLFISSFCIGEILTCGILGLTYIIIKTIIIKKYTITFKDIRNGSIAGFICGIFWTIGYYGQFITISSSLGLSIGFVVIQISLVISSTIGIVFFKEIKGFIRIFIFIIALIIIFPGVFLLSYFKK